MKPSSRSDRSQEHAAGLDVQAEPVTRVDLIEDLWIRPVLFDPVVAHRIPSGQDVDRSIRSRGGKRYDAPCRNASPTRPCATAAVLSAAGAHSGAAGLRLKLVERRRRRSASSGAEEQRALDVPRPLSLKLEDTIRLVSLLLDSAWPTWSTATRARHLLEHSATVVWAEEDASWAPLRVRFPLAWKRVSSRVSQASGSIPLSELSSQDPRGWGSRCWHSECQAGQSFPKTSAVTL